MNNTIDVINDSYIINKDESKKDLSFIEKLYIVYLNFPLNDILICDEHKELLTKFNKQFQRLIFSLLIFMLFYFFEFTIVLIHHLNNWKNDEQGGQKLWQFQFWLVAQSHIVFMQAFVVQFLSYKTSEKVNQIVQFLILIGILNIIGDIVTLLEYQEVIFGLLGKLIILQNIFKIIMSISIERKQLKQIRDKNFLICQENKNKDEDSISDILEYQQQ